MFIIRIDANENGSRPPIQSWNKTAPPSGYALVACDTAPFYEYRGFVDLTLDGVVCTGMVGNQAALDAYLAALPEAEPEPEADPTVDDLVNILLGVV